MTPIEQRMAGLRRDAFNARNMAKRKSKAKDRAATRRMWRSLAASWEAQAKFLEGLLAMLRPVVAAGHGLSNAAFFGERVEHVCQVALRGMAKDMEAHVATTVAGTRSASPSAPSTRTRSASDEP